MSESAPEGGGGASEAGAAPDAAGPPPDAAGPAGPAPGMAPGEPIPAPPPEPELPSRPPPPVKEVPRDKNKGGTSTGCCNRPGDPVGYCRGCGGAQWFVRKEPTETVIDHDKEAAVAGGAASGTAGVPVPETASSVAGAAGEAVAGTADAAGGAVSGAGDVLEKIKPGG